MDHCSSDCRGLNNITSKNKYPLLLIDSVFTPLHQATIFSQLDLRNAYHLVHIRERDEWKTAFSTPLGHFQYLVMPFGPSFCSCPCERCLRDMQYCIVFVYLDDILIFSRTPEKHIQHVQMGLQRLLENKLFVKAEKCLFLSTSVDLLGFIIEQGQERTDHQKCRW